MKKQNILIIIGSIFILGFVGFWICSFGVNYFFLSQYNDNGVSHFLVVTIDENQPR